jgi:hypothetical protein
MAETCSATVTNLHGVSWGAGNTREAQSRPQAAASVAVPAGGNHGAGAESVREVVCDVRQLAEGADALDVSADYAEVEPCDR